MTLTRQRSLDGGETLIEVTISILIMGILFVAIMSGLSTSIAVSTLHREQSNSQTIARDFSEYLQYATGFPYQSCGTVALYQPFVTAFDGTYTLPDGSHPLIGSPPQYTLTLNAVTYWDGNTSPAAFVGSCSPDRGAQRFDFTVQSQIDNRIALTLQVVKRK